RLTPQMKTKTALQTPRKLQNQQRTIQRITRRTTQPQHARRAASPQKRATSRGRWDPAWDDIPVDSGRGPLPRRPMHDEATHGIDTFAGNVPLPLAGIRAGDTSIPPSHA